MENLSRLIREKDSEAGVLLVGSAAKGETDGLNDLDLLVVGDWSKISALKSDPSYRDTCDYSMRFEFPNMPDVGILVKSIAELRVRIDEVLSGSVDLMYKPWAIGAEAPEGFLGDIAASRIITDTPMGDLSNLKSRVNNYPDQLGEYIMQNCHQELTLRIQQIEKAVLRKDYLSAQILKGHIIFVLMRLIFADQKMYFSGVKSIPSGKYSGHSYANILQSLVDANEVNEYTKCIVSLKDIL